MNEVKDATEFAKLVCDELNVRSLVMDTGLVDADSGDAIEVVYSSTKNTLYFTVGGYPREPTLLAAKIFLKLLNQCK